MIEPKEIEKLAQLARLRMSPEELAAIGKDLDAILAYVSELKEVDTTDLGTKDTAKLTNVLREDTEPYPAGSYTETILKAAPKAERGYIKVKKIL